MNFSMPKSPFTLRVSLLGLIFISVVLLSRRVSLREERSLHFNHLNSIDSLLCREVEYYQIPTKVGYLSLHNNISLYNRENNMNQK